MVLPPFRAIYFPWQVKIALSRGQEHESIGKLWARKKIAELMNRSIRTENGVSQRQEIVDIALEHHLVSKYTSLVAVDRTPVKPVDEHIRTTAVPVNLPHGWTMNTQCGYLPQTGTHSFLLIVLGLICLAAAISLRITFRNA